MARVGARAAAIDDDGDKRQGVAVFGSSRVLGGDDGSDLDEEGGEGNGGSRAGRLG